MKQRLDYVDEMKGLAILLVGLGHLFLPHTSEGQLHPCATIIYSFHMSFFFFLSGYINEKTNGISTKGMGTFIGKKFRSIMMPYFFWVLVAPIFLCNHIPTDWYEVVDIFNFFPNRHYWFLPVLFLFMLLYLLKYPLEKKGIKADLTYATITIGIFFLGGVSLHQYFLIVYGIYWASFLLGNCLSKYEKFRNLVMNNWVYGWCAIILCLAWKFYPIYPTDSIWQSIVNLFLSFMCSFVGSITLYNFFRKATLPECVKKYLGEMGKFSLVIYVVPITLLPQTFVFPSDWNGTLVTVIILLIGIAMTTLRYLFGRIVFEVPVLRYIMFGKK